MTEELVSEKHAYANAEIHRKHDKSEFLQQGRWFDKDRFIPSTCQATEYLLSDSEIESCFKDKSMVVIGDKKATILGTAIKHMVGDEMPIKILWSQYYSQIKSVQIEQAHKADYVIIGEQWQFKGEKSESDANSDFNEDFQFLKSILEPLEHSRVKIIVLAAEEIRRPSKQSKIDENREIYNEKLKKLVRSFDGDIYLMENNVLTDRDIDGELTYVDTRWGE